MSDLTPRQAAFVAAYIRCRNVAQAAREAGYSINGAATAGSNLLNLPKIADAAAAECGRAA